jgi:hypothetical protein
MNYDLILKEFIRETLLDEARKKRKRKKKKRKKKRPGRKEYYQGINSKGKKEMAREINKCTKPKNAPKNWKPPKSCYDSEWEADKKKYRTKK